MNIITIIILIIIIYGVIIYFRSKHKHEWVYSSSSKDNEYQWYYCPGCLMRSRSRIGENGLVYTQQYKLKVNKVKK
jgi:hypothetical protein